MKLIAILGGSGSGKSALGLELAERLDCEIFSLDSLAIYQELDIVSAKPTKEELETITHYGINVLSPKEKNNATLFQTLLLQAIQSSKQKGKDTLLIIGGSSFYLKSIIEGLSPIPQLTQEQKTQINQTIQALDNPFAFLQSIDPYCKIHPKDTYRVHKALEIYLSTKIPPTQFFKSNPKIPFPYPIEIYSLWIEREILRERILERTYKMLELGLLAEIQSLILKYGFHIQPINAIGVRESVEFLTQTPLEVLQNKPASKTIIAKNESELVHLISTHTAQLAKRQTTFNKTQFQLICASSQEIKSLILKQ